MSLRIMRFRTSRKMEHLRTRQTALVLKRLVLGQCDTEIVVGVHVVLQKVESGLKGYMAEP